MSVHVRSGMIIIIRMTEIVYYDFSHCGMMIANTDLVITISSRIHSFNKQVFFSFFLLFKDFQIITNILMYVVFPIKVVRAYET